MQANDQKREDQETETTDRLMNVHSPPRESRSAVRLMQLAYFCTASWNPEAQRVGIRLDGLGRIRLRKPVLKLRYEKRFLLSANSPPYSVGESMAVAKGVDQRETFYSTRYR